MYQGAKSLISRIFFSGVSGKYLESSSPIRLLLHLVGGSVSLVLEFIGNSKIYNKERKEGKKKGCVCAENLGSQDVTFTKCGCHYCYCYYTPQRCGASSPLAPSWWYENNWACNRWQTIKVWNACTLCQKKAHFFPSPNIIPLFASFKWLKRLLLFPSMPCTLEWSSCFTNWQIGFLLEKIFKAKC